MRLLILTIFILGPIITNAQVKIYEDSPISDIMSSFANYNRSNEFITGWRVQILATTNRLKLENTLQKLRSDYPHLNVLWEHAAPYYRIRTGAFSQKIDAFRFLHLMKKEFSGAYLVRDNKIKPGELVGYQ